VRAWRARPHPCEHVGHQHSSPFVKGRTRGIGRGVWKTPTTAAQEPKRGLSGLLKRLLLGAILLSQFVAPTAGAQPAPAGPEAAAATVHGKITRDTEPVAGAHVYAYSSFADLLAFRAAAASAPAGADGIFLLALPPGTYYLTARKHDGPANGPVPAGGLFAFHGSNPFTFTPGSSTEANFSLALKSAEARVASAADKDSATLKGVATWRGRGLEGVQVKLYLDEESAFRGAAFAAAPPTDASGAFSFEMLPQSSYYVVARRRGAGEGPGPLAEGDFYGYFVDNPVQVRAGAAVEIALELVSKSRDVGNADGRPRPTGTRIAGRILDAGGGVVRGVYAFAYEEKVMAHKKPAFISQEVDEKGRYVINLSRGGTFYVGARSAYGDSPGKGEWYGRYDGTPDHGVTVEAGATADGIDIRVERILE